MMDRFRSAITSSPRRVGLAATGLIGTALLAALWLPTDGRSVAEPRPPSRGTPTTVHQVEPTRAEANESVRVPALLPGGSGTASAAASGQEPDAFAAWRLRAEDLHGAPVPSLELVAEGSSFTATTGPAGTALVPREVQPWAVHVAEGEGAAILGWCVDPSPAATTIAILGPTERLRGRFARIVPESGLEEPLEGVHVEITGRVEDFFGERVSLDGSAESSSRLWRYARSEADGRFEIRDCPRHAAFPFRVWATGYEERTLRWEELSGRTVVLVPDATLVELHGRVVDPAGAGVAGAKVRVAEKQVATDHLGVFVAAVPRDPWPSAIHARADGIGIGSMPVPIPADATMELPDLELEPTLSLTGRVTHEGGAPAATTFVHVASRDGIDGEALPEARALGVPLLVATCDAQGRFAFDRLLPGNVRVVAVDAIAWTAEDATVTLPSQTACRITLPDPAPRLADVRGVCFERADGRPMAHRDVFLLPSDPRLRRFEVHRRLRSYAATTDEHGAFQLDDAPCLAAELSTDGASEPLPLVCAPEGAAYHVGRYRTLELAGQETSPADRIRVLDEHGTAMTIVHRSADGTGHATRELTRSENGRFPACEIPASAASLTIHCGVQQIASIDLPRTGRRLRIKL